MGLIIEANEKTLTVRLSGDIDHHSARALREQIDESVERTAPSALRLDFSNVTFMDSSGVGLIMGRYRLMRALEGRLMVCSVPSALDRMMRLAGLDRLEIWETEKGEGSHENDQ